MKYPPALGIGAAVFIVIPFLVKFVQRAMVQMYQSKGNPKASDAARLRTLNIAEWTWIGVLWAGCIAVFLYIAIAG